MENANSNVQQANQKVPSTESVLPMVASAPPESLFFVQPPPHLDSPQYPPAYAMPYPQNYPLSTPFAGYPQPYVPPSGRQPYYSQPVVYPGPPLPYCQTPQPQLQQPQQVFIVNSQALGMGPVFVAPVSMNKAIALSCFAFWFCGILFGGIAFIMAMIGRSSAAAGDTLGAMRWRYKSYRVSISAIVLGIILIAVFSGIYGSRRNNYYSSYVPSRNYDCNSYYYYGTYYSCK